jgi:hydroxyethylthiazole kinase-like uncharacterized protein yjeF
MTELLTAAQMRAIEQAAIASGQVTGLELMERAGRGVVEAVLAEWPDLAHTSGRALVLCGPGNNGGDGFVVARLLHQRGWAVEVFLYGDAERLPPDAKTNCARWSVLGQVRRMPAPKTEGGSMWPLWDIRGSDNRATRRVHPGLIVDALFGTGLTRPIDADLGLVLADLDAAIPEGSALHVAIDLPSGLCSDSGRVLGKCDHLASHADLTVTFHAPKLGHVLAEGPERCGKLCVVDIGLSRAPVPGKVVTQSQPSRYLLSKGGSAHLGGHKYTYGHALVLSGPPARGGAARLAARAALRIGAGLVTVGAPFDALAEHAARLDAIMLHEVDGDEALSVLLADKRLNAVCIGPGLGFAEGQDDLLTAALGWHLPRDLSLPLIDATPEQVENWMRRHGHRPACVVDADALTLLSRRDRPFEPLHDRCVLTPHAGEFARLFPDIAEKLDEPATEGPACSKVDATREAAARAGCVVVFKGPDTVIADPEGRCAINSAARDRAAPWLATGGTGDVLAGMICGLLARGFPPMHAAVTAAWLHVEAALSFGPGLIAEDLPEELPKVFRNLDL